MNVIGWGMAIYIYELIINKSKDLVLIIIFISLLYDENTINNHGFPSIHMWLKVGSECLCCYPCNEWLMRLVQII